MDEKKKFTAFDTLRGLCILCIVVYHVNFRRQFNDYIGFIYDYAGVYGNIFFFMISGFLMTYSYKERIAEKIVSFEDFFVRKVKGVAIYYFISEIIVIGCMVVRSGFIASEIKLDKIIYDFLLVTNGLNETLIPYNGPLWFINILLVCYMIHFFILKKSKNNKDLYFLLLLIMIFLGVACETKGWSVPFLYRTSGEGYSNYFLGALLYEIYSKIKDNSVKIKEALGISIASLLAITILLARYGIQETVVDVRIVCSFAVIPPVIICVLFLNPVRRILELKACGYLGSISKELFFFHIPVSMIYEDITTALFGKSISRKILMIVYLVCLILICEIIKHIKKFILKKFKNAA